MLLLLIFDLICLAASCDPTNTCFISWYYRNSCDGYDDDGLRYETPIDVASGAITEATVEYSDCGSGCNNKNLSGHTCRDSTMMYHTATGSGSILLQNNDRAAHYVDNMEWICRPKDACGSASPSTAPSPSPTPLVSDVPSPLPTEKPTPAVLSFGMLLCDTATHNCAHTSLLEKKSTITNVGCVSYSSCTAGKDSSYFKKTNIKAENTGGKWEHSLKGVYSLTYKVKVNSDGCDAQAVKLVLGATTLTLQHGKKMTVEDLVAPNGLSHLNIVNTGKCEFDAEVLVSQTRNHDVCSYHPDSYRQ